LAALGTPEDKHHSELSICPDDAYLLCTAGCRHSGEWGGFISASAFPSTSVIRAH